MRKRIGFLGLASGGLLAAHVADYALAVRDAAHRHALLAETGHGYLGPAAHIAGALAMFSVAMFIGLGFSRGRTGPRLSLRSASLRLIPLQTGAFVCLEVLERGFTGAPLGDLLGPLLWLGLALQVVVGFICAVLAVLLEHTGARWAAGRAARVGIHARIPVLRLGPARRLTRPAYASRAPPRLLGSAA